jgi:hypothetical protein
MKIAFFDTFCGASGDMIIGALLDAGLDFERLKTELAKLSLEHYQLRVEKTSRHHISATRFIVETSEHASYRSLADIEKIFNDSRLNFRIIDKCVNIFQKLASVEAKIHGTSIENVHFHEVGMVDAMVDVCGAVVGLDLLEIEKIYCSTLTIGRGMVETRHGNMPLPAPAAGELLKGWPTRFVEVDGEILTPTGAAILTSLCTFEDPGAFEPSAVGYGAGARDFPQLPNLLRLFIADIPGELETDEVLILESNFDRTPPEQLGMLMENLFAAGALDVFYTPILMKKNRPAQMLSVIADPISEKTLTNIIFNSGGTLGLRRYKTGRKKLPRKDVIAKTKFGDIAVKLAEFEGKVFLFPEYETVARIAQQTKTNFAEIYFEIQRQLTKEI